MKGQLRLQELPLCVSAWFFAGETYGRESRQSEIDQLEQRIRLLEHQLDTAYLQAYSPADRREIYQQRLDEHFRQRDAEFFQEPAQLNTLHSLRGGTTPPENGVEHGSSAASERSRRAA